MRATRHSTIQAAPPRRRPGRLAAALLAVLAAGWAGVGCDDGDVPDNAVRVGHVASLSGDTASFGRASKEGVDLAAEQINAAGGVLGRPLVVIDADDRSVTPEAATAARKLITSDGVVALVGEIASARSIAMAPVANDAQVPMLSPGSTNPKVTVDPADGTTRPYVFRACFIDEFQADALSRFAVENLGKRRFAILYASNSDYSVGLKDFITEDVRRLGGEVVAVESYQEKADKDFAGQLTKIKASDPEAIFLTGYYTEVGLIAQQARRLGIGHDVPLLGGDGWDSSQTIDVGGAAIEGSYLSNHLSLDEDRPAVRAFVAAYQAKYGAGKVPDAMTVLGYDAMRLMADAIERAGTTDGPAVRDALAATESFDGAAGAITIDDRHNARKPIVILQIKDGKYNYVTSIVPSDE